MRSKPWISAICMIMVLTVLLIGWGAPPAQAASLSLNKTSFVPGETIRVTFSPATGVEDSAWIGVIPSSVAHGDGDLADQYDSDYFWVSSYSGGVGELEAPHTAGSYDVRYISKDPGGVELASVTFTVGTGVTNAVLSLNKTVFSPGEKINVTFSPASGLPSQAWIGVIPSGIAHGDGDLADQHDTDYEWASSHPNGTLQLDAPSNPGSYDVRFFNTDPGGVELASVTFAVGSGPTSGTVSINKTVFSPGEKINVTFSPSIGVANSAWIGVIPSSIAHGDGDLADQHDTCYEWVRDHTNGMMQLIAPYTAGSYDVRYFSKDPGGLELASMSFTVSSATVPGTATGPIVVPGTIPGTVIPGTTAGSITLTATPGNMQVKLDWTVPSSMTGIIGYHLFRGTSPGGESTTPVTDFLITGNTHTDKNVVNGTTYYYILKPVYSGNIYGIISNEVSATPTGSGTPGTAGTNVIILQIGNPNVQVNGVTKVIDAPATIVNGRTMVPLRFLVEAMGGTVNWDAVERMITLNVKNTEILLWLDSTRTLVNGQEKFTDVPPQIINERTMVPLRFILENLNCQVNWESSTKTVTIIY
ncbi:MAG: copper amine oxidase N-terminal domain-containing protein [Firmicutes bacterium]|nr:copper amine oxidase N-terminal domain-containing protein [Bacillota bacterium]